MGQRYCFYVRESLPRGQKWDKMSHFCRLCSTIFVRISCFWPRWWKLSCPILQKWDNLSHPPLYYSSVGCCKSTNNTQPRINDVQTLFLNKTSVICLCDSGSRSTSVATPARTTMATARATIFPSRTMATSCVVVPRMRKEPRQHQWYWYHLFIKTSTLA